MFIPKTPIIPIESLEFKGFFFFFFTNQSIQSPRATQSRGLLSKNVVREEQGKIKDM